MKELLFLITLAIVVTTCQLPSEGVKSRSYRLKSPCFNSVTTDSVLGLTFHGKNMNDLYNEMQLKYILSFSSLKNDSLGFSVFGKNVQFIGDTCWHLDLQSIDSVIVHRHFLNTLELLKSDTISRPDHLLLSKNTQKEVFSLLYQEVFKEYAAGIAINAKKEKLKNADENIFVKTIMYGVIRSNAFLDCQKGNMDQELIYYKRSK